MRGSRTGPPPGRRAMRSRTRPAAPRRATPAAVQAPAGRSIAVDGSAAVATTTRTTVPPTRAASSLRRCGLRSTPARATSTTRAAATSPAETRAPALNRAAAPDGDALDTGHQEGGAEQRPEADEDRTEVRPRIGRERREVPRRGRSRRPPGHRRPLRVTGRDSAQCVSTSASASPIRAPFDVSEAQLRDEGVTPRGRVDVRRGGRPSASGSFMTSSPVVRILPG